MALPFLKPDGKDITVHLSWATLALSCSLFLQTPSMFRVRWVCYVSFYSLDAYSYSFTAISSPYLLGFFVNICSIAPDASLAVIMRREVAFRASSGSKENRTIERTDFIFCFSSLCPIVVFVGPHLHKLTIARKTK